MMLQDSCSLFFFFLLLLWSCIVLDIVTTTHHAVVDLPCMFPGWKRYFKLKRETVSFFFPQWCTLKALWAKSPCPLVILLVGPSVQCTQSKLKLLRRWLLAVTWSTGYCVDLTFHVMTANWFFFFDITTGAKRHQTTAAGDPEQNRKGAVGLQLHAFVSQVPHVLFRFPNKVFCSSVVHSSSRGGGVG